MAPTAADVELQTTLIIQCLFDEQDHRYDRQLSGGLETDGIGDEDDGFDPVLIADRLRRIGDALAEDPRFNAALTDLKKAAAQEAMEEAFSQSVEVLCQKQLSSSAEVAPEVQLIKASVAVGLYIKNSAPELKNKVKSVMASFINRRVGPWIAQQGGWEKVAGHSV
ncbi:apoptosis facilitator Bcl-2-like protein 14 [Salarias fasciatus]|uniref:apoptosis facilitator Bcl-2-like protein 14 n=1 Tax=Salarias fasciatus TaxID=181472 RepID=UPI001176A81F|nr:apoptosis facilitator Bcl-2-like protein 14 [Salarias fasciatus]